MGGLKHGNGPTAYYKAHKVVQIVSDIVAYAACATVNNLHLVNQCSHILSKLTMGIHAR